MCARDDNGGAEDSSNPIVSPSPTEAVGLMDQEIWVVFPDRDRAQTAPIRDNLRRECLRRGWGLQEKRSIGTRVGGRPLQTLSGEDAVNLYRRSHRARVGVLFAGRPAVLPRPGKPRRSEKTINLATFLRYKAYAARLPATPACLSSYLDAYESWCQDTGCENDHDPRCLPFHVFASEQTDLDTSEERQRFNAMHDPGGRRRDERDFTWCLGPRPFHGREVLQVAGYTLPPRVPLGRLGASQSQDDHDTDRTVAGLAVHQHRAGRPSERQAATRKEDKLRVRQIENRKARKNRAFRACGALGITSADTVCGIRSRQRNPSNSTPQRKREPDARHYWLLKLDDAGATRIAPSGHSPWPHPKSRISLGRGCGLVNNSTWR